MRQRLLALVIVFGGCVRTDRPAPPPPESANVVTPVDRKWTLTDRGFGPLVTGISPADAVTATHGAVSVPAAAAPGQCVYAEWRGAPAGLSVMFEDGVLVRIDVTSPGIATADGLQVGNSRARADSLYGAVATRRLHKYEAGEYLIVRPLAPADTLQRLVIEVVAGKVRRFRGGRFPQVEYVEGCG
jgi:hypothetical protein